MAHISTSLPDLAVAIASYPEHAGSVDELVDVARAAMQNAEKGMTVAPSERLRSSPHVTSIGLVIGGTRTREVFRMAQRLADAALPVLVLGETGSGKEVFARCIHEASARKAKPMVCVNCGSLPPQLVQSTLFGHVKGAFTSASQSAKGAFETADGGTVMLDEIGELPLEAQANLLRVIETGRFCPVGSSTELEVDVRFIAATHRDLDAMIRDGTFRQDLFFRLNGLTLHVPPLRERLEELEPLAMRFLQLANEANGRSVERIQPQALELLKRHAWPGNLRELRNVIERAVVITHGNAIGVDDLPVSLRQLSDMPQDLAGGQSSLLATSGPPAESSDEPATPLPEAINLRSELQRYESELIVRALEATDWQRKLAAKLLGLPLRTLAHRIKTLGISRRDS